jgi:hypothetical protein
LDDYDFWCVAFETQDGVQIYRKDADENEIVNLLTSARNPLGDKYIKLWREFHCTVQPKKWTMWPHSKSKGWCDKITGKL